MANSIPTKLTELTENTVSTLIEAKGDSKALENAMLGFLESAKELGLSQEQIEDLLGVNEQSIMDLAQLDEADEETVINFFEEWSESRF